jgi:hypothetical protein
LEFTYGKLHLSAYGREPGNSGIHAAGSSGRKSKGRKEDTPSGVKAGRFFLFNFP